MRIAVLALAAAAAVAAPTIGAQAPSDDLPPLRPASTMSELMIDVIYPASDAVLYITTRTPETEQDWQVLQMKTLMLAESGNVLMLPRRARPGDVWTREARAMYDAGAAAYRAAKDRDLDALAALNEPLYLSCVNCHRAYRPNYGRGGRGRR